MVSSSTDACHEKVMLTFLTFCLPHPMIDIYARNSICTLRVTELMTGEGRPDAVTPGRGEEIISRRELEVTNDRLRAH
ncbi:hypothetical protein RRG08_016963 [Elysia crispata]|uniref:Uncharacterized protein n=1 Tax=Elysia crispata TaxID=231223 RepID=A0AAE0XZL1_9GAST|nr:hypothetical protein RRG08_016963 [Elysia crispata]